MTNKHAAQKNMTPETLDDEQRAKFIRRIMETTNAVRSHESEIIAAILGTDIGKDAWRFRKGLTCKGCRRELKVLDYFLASLKHHDAAFIRSQIESGAGDEIDRIELVRHPVRIPCLECGTEYVSESYNPYYRHPGGPHGGVIRISPEAFAQIASEI